MDYPEVLQDLADQVGELLKKRGVSPDEAAELGWETAEFLRDHWGGQKIYIPKAITFIASRRDLEIYHRWNGTNGLALCREYGLSDTRLRQIIIAIRKARRGPDPQQPELFKEVVK